MPLPYDFEVLVQLAKKDNIEAQRKLADMYVVGEADCEQNYEQAGYWYAKAAAKGDASAQKCLGNMYANGVGVKQDYERAFLLYEASAAQGNMKAIFNLSLMYQIGHHADQNYNKAYKLCRQSAESGYVSAQLNLALLLANGTGCEVDLEESAEWLKAAAKQENATAQVYLAIAYAEGKGVEKDCKTAVEWYERAANHGDIIAQHNLAELMLTGEEGIDQDIRKAYYWMKIAEKCDDEITRIDMNFYEEHLSESERVEIERHVHTWKPIPQKRLSPLFNVEELKAVKMAKELKKSSVA